MKTKILKILGAAAVFAAASFLATPYYLGIKAEQSLDRQHQILSETAFLKVESRRYERGWFSSQETVILRFHPAFLAKMRPHLPDNLKILLDQPITLNNRIRHHLFADGLMPVRAVADTEFTFQEESRAILQRFFGNQAPATLRNTIALNGSGKMVWNIPAFRYSELSGIAIDWQGLTGETEYGNAFATHKNSISVPELSLKLADQGNLTLQGLFLAGDSRENAAGLPPLGSRTITLDRFTLTWKEDIRYDIRLNDFVNILADLHIGSFINPYGTLNANTVSLEKLLIHTETAGNADLIDTQGRFTFDALTHGDTRYGPLRLTVSAEHLDAAALALLQRRGQEWAAGNLDEQALREALLQSIRGETSALFTRDPRLNLDRFELTLPQGQISGKGSIAFTGLTREDLDNVRAMMQKSNIRLDIGIPQELIEQLAIAQARNYISVDPELGNADAEIADAVRLWVGNMINVMIRQGYLKADGGNISTNIEIDGRQLTMNGIEIDLPGQDSGLLPDSTLAPSAP